jgi:anti-sigma regulatory factor (Ser/Thr protein kinase)
VSGSAPVRKAAPLLRLVLPSQTEFLGLVREVAQRLGEGAGFDAETAKQIALATDEAVSNVLEHAYRGRTDRELEVAFLCEGPDFRVEVTDTGVGVDPRHIPRVDLARYATERRTGGLGLHLMAKIMDSVTFSREAAGNVCTLSKRRPPGTSSNR